MLIKFLSVKTVCERLEVGVGMLLGMVERGEFPVPFMIGQRRKWLEEDVEAWQRHLPDVCGKTALDPTRLPWLASPAGVAEVFHLLGLAMEFPACESAVYFLIRGKEVMYVGQSADLPARIGKHRAAGRKDPERSFDRVFYLPALPANLLQLERNYIQIFNPPWNIKGTIDLDE